MVRKTMTIKGEMVDAKNIRDADNGKRKEGHVTSQNIP